jgi:hypothetical protein
MSHKSKETGRDSPESKRHKKSSKLSGQNHGKTEHAQEHTANGDALAQICRTLLGG